MSYADPETTVDAKESPAARCPHCGRPFTSERASALHVGDVHPEAATDAERDAYEDARDDEERELFYFHMKVIIALGIIHAFIFLLYMAAFAGDLA